MTSPRHLQDGEAPSPLQALSVIIIPARPCAPRALPVTNLPLPSCSQGNLLLVGVGGSGKQSLSRLAAYTSGCEVFEITLTRGYDDAAFREDLKKLYGMLGSDDKKVVFLFTDAHVADEGFLELINNMLTSGMVPALYDDAEKEGLVSRWAE